MDNFKDFYNRIIRNKYNYGTGSWTIINPEIKTIMNRYGEYAPYVENLDEINITESEFDLLKKVTLLSDDSPDESEISSELFKNVDGIKYDHRVGFYLNCYAGYVKEGDFRKNGSSGGFATWIFKELLERKLIDGVIHVKPNMNSSDSVLFKYDVSHNIEELCKGSKTKYYPVEFSEAIQYIKEKPGKYAFIGGPSFVMSLRLLQKVDEVLNERIIFMVGLITAHQKSAKYTEAIAWQCGIKPGDLISINYRVKSKDNSPNHYIAEMTGYIDGKKTTIVKSMRKVIGTGWGQGFFKIKASDFTDDILNETADIALGDAWLPRYMKDTGGTNILVVRNPQIDSLIKEGLNNNKIFVEEVSLDDVYKSQTANYRHTTEELPYRLFKKDKANEWRPRKRVEASNNISYLRRKVQDWREEISTKSHLIYERAVELDDLNYYITEMRKLTKKYVRVYRMIAIQKKGLIGSIKAITKRLLK